MPTDGQHQFGPWPKGLNTMQSDPELEPDELRAAINVDITAEGFARQRPGTSKVYSGAACHSLGPNLLFIEGSTLKRYNPDLNAATSLQTGLKPGARAVYEAVNDQIYWTNGYDSGRVDPSFTAYPWGLQVPDTPAIGAGTGGLLPAGLYQVACSFSTASGEESGVGLAASVQVADNGAIALTAVPQPQAGQGITTINVYVSAANGQITYWHGSVAVGTTTYAILSFATTKREARNLFLTKPPPGRLLTTRKGRIYIGAGNLMHWTEPLAYGLYDPAKNFMAFDSELRVMRAVTNGIWVVTATKTLFIAGDNPNEATMDIQADYSAPYQTAVDLVNDNDVAWLSHRGWVRGTNGGEIVPMAEERVQVNKTDGYTPTMYRESNGIRQFVGLAPGSPKPPVNSSDFNKAF